MSINENSIGYQLIGIPTETINISIADDKPLNFRVPSVANQFSDRTRFSGINECYRSVLMWQQHEMK